MGSDCSPVKFWKIFNWPSFDDRKCPTENENAVSLKKLGIFLIFLIVIFEQSESQSASAPQNDYFRTIVERFSKTMTKKSCSPPSSLELQKSCFQDLCRPFFEKQKVGLTLSGYEEGLIKIALNANSYFPVKKLKMGLSKWADLIKSQLESTEAVPNYPAFNRAANIRLAATDCELMNCTDNVRSLAFELKLFREENRDRYMTNIKGNVAGLRANYKLKLMALRLKHAEDWAVNREDFEKQMSFLEKFEPAQLAHAIELLDFQLHVLSSPSWNERYSLAPESLRTVWYDQHIQTAEISRNVDEILKKCSENAAAKIVALPQPKNELEFQTLIAPEVVSQLEKLSQKNFSEMSSVRIVKYVKEVIKPQHFSGRWQALQNFRKNIVAEIAVYDSSISKTKEGRQLNAYNLSLFPTFLANNCGLPALDRTNEFRNFEHLIQNSSETVNMGYSAILGHELTHAIEGKIKSGIEISSHTRTVHGDIIACLKRKVKGTEKLQYFSEDFADLGMALVNSSKPEIDVCSFQSGWDFFEKSPGGHSSDLFRALHVQSYSKSTLPKSCRDFLQLENISDLFSEKCIKAP